MTMTADIVAYIVANIGATWIDPAVDSVNGNIFQEFLSNSPDRACGVFGLKGRPTQLTFGGLRAWENPELKITTRASQSEGFSVAQSDAFAVWSLLDVVVNKEIGSSFYMRLHADGKPESQGLDVNQRPVYVQTYSVMKYI
jgi:hypothetical protein